MMSVALPAMKPCSCLPRRKRLDWPCQAVLATGLAAGAAGAATPPLELNDHEGQGWFVRAGARTLFNVKASVARVPTQVTPGVYDNGFVLPDLGGTASGQTWNWGYQRAAQRVGNEIRMQRLTDVPMAGLFETRTADPSVGGELMTGLEFARFFVAKREARFGFEIGYGYNSLSFPDTSSVNGQSTLTFAGFNLGGATPPPAPYSGTFQGPGPRLGLEPSSLGTVQSPARAVYDGKLEAELHNFKAGFWFQYPLVKRLSANLSFGYCSLYADARLRFTESISYDHPGFLDMPATPHTVGGRAWKSGAYAQLRMQYHFSPRLGAFLGGDYQYNKELRFAGEGREITLDLESLLAATAGVVFEF